MSKWQPLIASENDSRIDRVAYVNVIERAETMWLYVRSFDRSTGRKTAADWRNKEVCILKLTFKFVSGARISHNPERVYGVT